MINLKERCAKSPLLLVIDALLTTFDIAEKGKRQGVTSYPVLEFVRGLEEDSQMQRKSLETWELLGGILWLWPSLLNLFTLTYAF